MDLPVLLTEHPARNGMRVARICLNAPKSLNALTLPMIDLIAPKLREWEEDPAIACVFLTGSGDRAFCAGGDIRALYEGMTGQRHGDFCEQFFTREYQLDYHLHTYSKPLICWGDGVVMGGGIGMMSGAGFRVVTERSRLSMPEISIGLYPDVAGSWFLNHMPGKLGLFLALTGAPLNGLDALQVSLADFFVASDLQEACFSALLDAQWGALTADNWERVAGILQQLQQQSLSSLPEPQALPMLLPINEILAAPMLSLKVQRLLDFHTDSTWFKRAQKALAAGSPSSMAIIDRQLQLSRYVSLAEVYRSELNLSMHCAEDGEFAEGIRALLIDKDQQPQWRFDSVDAVDPTWLDGMFQPRWCEQNHPLIELGAD